MRRLAEELKAHPKVSVKQSRQPVYGCAVRGLGRGAPLSHLVGEIFNNGQKDRCLVLKIQVDRALSHLCRLGNIIDGSLTISVLQKQLQASHYDGISLCGTTLGQSGTLSLNPFHSHPIQLHLVYYTRLYGILYEDSSTNSNRVAERSRCMKPGTSSCNTASRCKSRSEESNDTKTLSRFHRNNSMRSVFDPSLPL